VILETRSQDLQPYIRGTFTAPIFGNLELLFYTLTSHFYTRLLQLVRVGVKLIAINIHRQIAHQTSTPNHSEVEGALRGAEHKLNSVYYNSVKRRNCLEHLARNSYNL
jgi:hypothetical protein